MSFYGEEKNLHVEEGLIKDETISNREIRPAESRQLARKTHHYLCAATQ